MLWFDEKSISNIVGYVVRRFWLRVHASYVASTRFLLTLTKLIKKRSILQSKLEINFHSSFFFNQSSHKKFKAYIKYSQICFTEPDVIFFQHDVENLMLKVLHLQKNKFYYRSKLKLHSFADNYFFWQIWFH